MEKFVAGYHGEDDDNDSAITLPPVKASGIAALLSDRSRRKAEEEEDCYSPTIQNSADLHPLPPANEATTHHAHQDDYGDTEGLYVDMYGLGEREDQNESIENTDISGADNENMMQMPPLSSEGLHSNMPPLPSYLTPTNPAETPPT